jgi:hypothetical protein
MMAAIRSWLLWVSCVLGIGRSRKIGSEQVACVTHN